MYKRRDRTAMTMDLLTHMRGGVKKPTVLMSKANLSWKTMQEVLAYLVDKSLIKEWSVGNALRYTITKKGCDALDKYDAYTKIIK